ncbi:MAG: hypothetical protein WC399_01150 [Bacilli bacterium]|jgi:hypothetical protein
MIVKLMSEMTLAFCFAEGENARRDNEKKIRDFLSGHGLDPEATKRYFFRISVTHGDHKHVTHMRYALVPEGTTGTREVAVVHLPAGEYLSLSISKKDYEDEANAADEKISQAAKTWLAENNKRFDMKNVIGLIEEDFVDGYEMYNLYFPIK